LVSGNLPFVTTYQGVLTALGVEHRVRILERLATAPASVGELAELLPISRPAVSQHLRVLHEQDLVTYDAAGTRNIYRLETAGLVALRDWLNDIWPTAFDRYVEYATAHTQAEGTSP
jgi:DNA-binding transcriptional ArsR family regulator